MGNHLDTIAGTITFPFSAKRNRTYFLNLYSEWAKGRGGLDGFARAIGIMRWFAEP
jgi:hypothetical protein